MVLVTALDERAHVDAWKASLETPLEQWSAYDYSEVPAVLPKIYVALSVKRRFGGEARNTGRKPITGWRLTTREVGRTEDEARWARNKVASLNETRNATLGSGLLAFESQTDIAKDGDRYAGLTVWTYTTLA